LRMEGKFGSIYENNQEIEPQDVTSALSYFAKLYQAQNDYEQAEVYYQPAFMLEQEPGSDHPDTSVDDALRGSWKAYTTTTAFVFSSHRSRS
jgi:hypothetical protein